MKERMIDAVMFPILAILTIVVFAGGLGVIFMVIETTAVGVWGVVVVGTAIVIGVPSGAALLQNMAEKE
ncbi:MAG: hypothetical protein IIC84_05780 [Chloroflexi bacterium]|nr:hypothetical protein [Chloroflexota bacterium]